MKFPRWGRERGASGPPEGGELPPDPTDEPRFMPPDMRRGGEQTPADATPVTPPDDNVLVPETTEAKPPKLSKEERDRQKAEQRAARQREKEEGARQKREAQEAE